MKKITIGIVAHVDAGKTTLSEGLLYKTGIIRNMGRVDTKNAFLDSYALEREGGITIFSKQAVFAVGDKEFTLLDTPGHVDFSAETERTLKVLDYAILLISAMDGVTGHTKTLWKLLRLYDIPTIIFVNKMDSSGADRNSIAIGLEKNLSEGCIDLSDEDAMEKIAMCDEDALSEFLRDATLSEDTLQSLICERKLFPCFYGSALKLYGIDSFIKGLERLCVPRDYEDEFSARVFKISRDENGNRLTHLKVMGGSLAARTLIGEEKINQIRIYNGEKYVTATVAKAGTVCAVTGLAATSPGDCLGADSGENKAILEPVLSYCLQLPKECPPALFLPKLRELEEEEPELSVVWDDELSEIHLRVMGEVQLEVLKSIIKERYNVDVSFGTGRIVYKETIRNTVEGVGHFEPLRHYAEVHLLMEPLERGAGLVFESACSEDVLEKNWQRLILTHLREKVHRGVLVKGQITDMKISIINGRAHKKHTEGGDFRQATYRAVRQGLMKAESVLLEPYYSFVIELPDTNIGRALSDLENMHGRFTIDSQSRGTAVIKGMAAVRLINGYQLELNTYTKGRGRMNVCFCGYYECPDSEQIIDETSYDPVGDLRNTPDSVFCANGAGYVVPWNEVEAHMHCEGYMTTKKEAQLFMDSGKEERNSLDEWMATEEIDQIMDRTFFANSRQKGNHVKWQVHRKKASSGPAVNGEIKRNNSDKASALREKYLLVDGYNTIFAWDELNEIAKSNIDGARGRLLDILSNYQGIKKMNLIVVFDAYRVTGHVTEIFDYHNIHVVYTKEAETADAFIEKFSVKNSGKYDITVATSDGLEQIIIRGQGCRLLSSREFEREIKEACAESMQNYEESKNSGRNFLADMVPEINRIFGENDEV